VRKIGFSGQAPKCRALSLRGAAWQSGMAAVLLLAIAAPLSATPGGELGTMPRGDYICELPGDATGPAGTRVPDEDFSVVTASSYRAGDAMGSYLLTGDQLIMTGGPHMGKRYKRVSQGFVRLLDAQGRTGDVRCVRRKPNNA
jgi:hypothetical protein